MARAPAVKRSRLRSSGTRGALAKPSSTEHLHRAPGGGDPLARLAAERVQPDRERVREGTVGEALDRPPLANDAARGQLGRTDRGARRKGGELPEIHDRPFHPRDGPEAPLREPALERHLATLVPGRAVAPGTRTPAFVAAAGRLALTRTRTAADALGGPGRAGGRMQPGEIHRHSSTATRCATARSM